MAWVTPGMSRNRAESSGWGLRRMPMATRWPPGMGWATKPRTSILATTAWICSGLASLSMTMSMGVSVKVKPGTANFQLHRGCDRLWKNRLFCNSERSAGSQLLGNTRFTASLIVTFGGFIIVFEKYVTSLSALYQENAGNQRFRGNSA